MMPHAAIEAESLPAAGCIGVFSPGVHVQVVPVACFECFVCFDAPSKSILLLMRHQI